MSCSPVIPGLHLDTKRIKLFMIQRAHAVDVAGVWVYDGVGDVCIFSQVRVCGRNGSDGGARGIIFRDVHRVGRLGEGGRIVIYIRDVEPDFSG
uniref:Uncharacterized protein n=1 Tax=Nothobranchius furzeri TaxID=105023 RepID=A0A8C6K8L0_NOTFU